jgi:hypothetical protein
MNKYIENNQQLVELCNKTSTDQGIDAILTGLAPVFPELQFEHVLSRGGWYRLGGVVDANSNRITDNIASWAEQESAGDMEQLVLKYIDSVYFATRLSGQTHFFTVSTGDKPEQFIQLEIEEIQEVLDRPLVERDWFPDSMQDFLDPIDYTKLEPEPVGKSRYIFRRITNMDQLIHQTAIESRHLKNIRRFLEDWQHSSANDTACFCQHWVLALREFADRDGYRQVNAKPVATISKGPAELPEIEGKSGAELSTAIQRYDNVMGYHFSWFFMMLSSQSDNFVLADAVLRDQSGEYDYIPVKDLKVLTDWATDPYSV